MLIYHKRKGEGVLSVAVFARISSKHKDDTLFFVYLIKEAIIADSVPPGIRLVILQLLDVLPKIWIAPELRIDIF